VNVPEYSGQLEFTRAFKIHYGEKGTHIVPAPEKEKEKEKEK
jgi:hypothetical protein